MDKSPRRYFYQPEASVRTQTIRMLVSSLQGGKTWMYYCSSIFMSNVEKWPSDITDNIKNREAINGTF